MLDYDYQLDDTRELQPELRLWRGVVNQILADADYWRRGKKPPSGDMEDGEEAHLELMHGGPLLRRACTYADLDAIVVSWAYRRYLANQTAAA